MKKLFIPFLFTIVWYGCSTTKPKENKAPVNKSHYHIQKYTRSQEQDSAIIVINAYNTSGSVDYTIECFFIKVNDNIFSKDPCVGYSVFTLPADNYEFKVKMVGYDSVKTHKFFVGAADSINIDFYLEQDISLHQK